MRAAIHLRPLFAAGLLAVSTAGVAQNAMTTREVTVRAGPDRSYPLVARLETDTPIQVMGCLDDWSWCDVAFQEDRGWMYAPDLTYSYEGGYVPLYSYAPGLGIPVVAFSIDSYWGEHYRQRDWYAQRTEWEHRGINHERPSGPPPSAGPPPRPAHDDRAAHAGHPDRDHPLRLGSAGSAEPRDAAPQHEEHARPEQQREAAPRQEHAAPAEHSGEAQPRHDEHAAPTEHSAGAQPRHDEHAAPQKHEEQAAPQKRKEEKEEPRGEHPEH